MCQCLVAEKNILWFVSLVNQIKANKILSLKQEQKEDKKPLLCYKKKLLLLSEIPYMLKHRCRQSGESPIVLAIRTFSFYQDTHIFFSMTSRVCLLEGGPPFPSTTSHVTPPLPNVVALLRHRYDNTSRHHPRPPPSGHSHHPNV